MVFALWSQDRSAIRDVGSPRSVERINATAEAPAHRIQAVTGLGAWAWRVDISSVAFVLEPARRPDQERTQRMIRSGSSLNGTGVSKRRIIEFWLPVTMVRPSGL